MNDLQRLKCYELELYRQTPPPPAPRNSLPPLVTAHGQSACKVLYVSHTETKYLPGHIHNKNAHVFCIYNDRAEEVGSVGRCLPSMYEAGSLGIKEAQL